MFYRFRQNNSGGNFIINDNVAHFVYVEACCEYTAINKAEEVGLYFDGIGDCNCCGHRWHNWPDAVIDKRIGVSDDMKFIRGEQDSYGYDHKCRVHHIDGSIGSI